jgi:hypothetical protein
MQNPLIQRGEFLVSLGNTATTLCPEHAQHFAITAMLLEQQITVYELDPDEPNMACQTCFMLHQAGLDENQTH